MGLRHYYVHLMGHIIVALDEARIIMRIMAGMIANLTFSPRKEES